LWFPYDQARSPPQGGGGSGGGGAPEGHDYLAKNPICMRPLGDSARRDLLRRFGIPNAYTQGSDQGGTGYHVATWSLMPGGVVRTDFAPNGLAVSNTTTWLHAFVGTIDRSIENTNGGAYFVTHGYGSAGKNYVPNNINNPTMFTFYSFGSLRDGLNDALGPLIFGAVDDQAALYARHHFEGC
jgi:hypothetical protein